MSDRLVLTTSYPRDAEDSSGHFVECEVRAAIERGERVRVLACGQIRPTESDSLSVLPLGGPSLFAAPGALERLRERPTRALVLPVVGARLFRLLRSAPERVWEAHFLLPFGPLAAAIAPGRAATLTLVGHGTDVRLLARLPRPLLRAFARVFANPGVRLRFVSEELRARFLDLSPFADLRARTFVEPARLELPEVPSRAACRQELGVPASARVAVVVGRLIPSKRVGTALSALLLVPEARVFVVGDGPERRDLEGRFREVTFVGSVPRPVALRYVRAADVLVSSSRLEGAPSIVREARALDVPVVATAAGDLAEWSKGDSELFVVA